MWSWVGAESLIGFFLAGGKSRRWRDGDQQGAKVVAGVGKRFRQGGAGIDQFGFRAGSKNVTQANGARDVVPAGFAGTGTEMPVGQIDGNAPDGGFLNFVPAGVGIRGFLLGTLQTGRRQQRGAMRQSEELLTQQDLRTVEFIAETVGQGQQGCFLRGGCER